MVWRWSFSSTCSKFYIDSKNGIKTVEKILVLKINGFELVAGISVCYDKNRCDRQSTS